jgi:hypothetical protein
MPTEPKQINCWRPLFFSKSQVGVFLFFIYHDVALTCQDEVEIELSHI